MSKKIGFIGLGVMGSAFAERLVKTGYDVVVYDVLPEAVEKIVEMGAASAANPKEVALQAEIVMTSLPNPPIVNEVYRGKDSIIEGCSEGMVLIDLSTVDPGTTKKNYEIFKEIGVDLIDSPVSGGPDHIRKGILPSILVGGDKDVVEANLDYIKNFGTNIYYCGAIGSGNVLKLINNMMSATNNAIAAEAMVLGTKAGVDPDLLYEVLTHSGGRTSQLGFFSKLLQRDFSPDFKNNLAKKDVGLAMDLARSITQPTPIAAAVFELMEEVCCAGYGEESSVAVAKLYENWGGLEVKGEGKPQEINL